MQHLLTLLETVQPKNSTQILCFDASFNTRLCSAPLPTFATKNTLEPESSSTSACFTQICSKPPEVLLKYVEKELERTTKNRFQKTCIKLKGLVVIVVVRDFKYCNFIMEMSS